ncbi:hypothetical protein [Rothia sp. ZJ932]|uniref:hypothetical protein n=1 Tax=Rothia sp. ZJ932 TaxID=2810516 RepID=UPI0019685BD2|nr:hypothetical protein [Rothia sp. ZJ932]QRZ62178.1 hypothetical protein JR346_03430 [Rothia sp. ZJ932]
MEGKPTTTASHQDRLPDALDIGAVRLRVRNMKTVYKFYTRGVGLHEILYDGKDIWLGLGNKFLNYNPHLRQPARTEAGLFHVADTPHNVALSIVSTLSRHQDRYVGLGDHLVSEAFYLAAPPEGKGVGLYRDCLIFAGIESRRENASLSFNAPPE